MHLRTLLADVAVTRLLARYAEHCPLQLDREFAYDSNLPLRLFDPIMEAYGREPLPTAFGISQAITLAAQRFNPEERLELEQTAGQCLGG